VSCRGDQMAMGLMNPKPLSLLSILILLLFPPGLLGTQVTAVQLSSEANTLSARMLKERENRQLPALSEDLILSCTIERCIAEILQEHAAGELDSVLPVELSHYVPDWNKTFFLCIAASPDEIGDKLLANPAFVRELWDTGYTHIVASTGIDSAGHYVGIIGFIRRLVYLNPTRVDVAFEGPTYVSLSGRAPGVSSMRVVFYKGTVPPTQYQGTQYESRDVALEDNGNFEVTLPISALGKGEYRIVIYVKPRGDHDFVIATWHEFTVW